jgi:RimJ/RimL family protein N-acetyltransferase
MNNDPTSVDANVRILSAADVNQFWPLRLRALKEEPESFGMSYIEAVGTPIEQVTQRLHSSDDSFVLGAFAPHLVGMVGCFREHGQKRRHKATIWGMYVAPEARGKGLGKALVENLIARAGSIPELERLVLSVVTTNEAARQLYLSLGFASYGIEPDALRVADKYLDEDLLFFRLNTKRNQEGG